MAFHFQPAAAPLASAVRAFWGFDDDDASGAHEERIVPDGCAEIVVHFGAPFSERSAGGHREQPRALFAGQITRPLWLRPGATADVFAARLQPDGARRLGLPPQWMLADLRIPFEDLLAGARRNAWRDTLERMAGGDFRSRVQAMSRFIASDLRGGARDATQLCVGTITRHAGNCDLAGVAREAGLSMRQLQRRFLSDVGVTPKLFARIVRFQRVFERWDASPGDWARVAVECGYYDQPHLLRDFRQFAGEPPAALMAALAPLGASLAGAR